MNTANYVKGSIQAQVMVIMAKKGISVDALAKNTQVSNTQLRRTLDPDNETISLKTLVRIANGLGCRLEITLKEDKD